VEQKDRADTLRVKAETSETETRRLRMLAVARGLALQTTRLAKDEQKELAALLAAQAFRLHEKNGGSPEDAQLFEALRAALTRLAPETAGVLRLHQDAVRTLALAPGGRLVASGSDDGSVRVFGLDAAESGSRLVASLGSEVRAIAWVDGGKHLAAGTLDGRVFLLDASAEGDRSAPVASAAPGLTALAYRADGDLLASASLNGEVSLWPAGTNRTARILQRAGEPRVAALSFTTDGRLVGASDTGGLVVWDPGRPDAAPRRLLVRRKLRSLAVAPDGTIAAGTVEGPILVLTRGLEETPVELAGTPRASPASDSGPTGPGSLPRASTGASASGTCGPPAGSRSSSRDTRAGSGRWRSLPTAPRSSPEGPTGRSGAGPRRRSRCWRGSARACRET
jgi:hypothetical protein